MFLRSSLLFLAAFAAESMRRKIMNACLQVSLGYIPALKPIATYAADDITASSARIAPLSRLDISSLTYEKRLGSGTFKTVYMVSLGTAVDEKLSSSQPRRSFALAVQKLREKSDVKDGRASIRIAQELRSRLSSDSDKQYFEEIVDWWFQASPPLEFKVGGSVFSPNNLEEQTHKPPRRFLGTRWLLSLKPVYEMDLRKFCCLCPNVHPIAGKVTEQYAPLQIPQSSSAIAGVAMTESGATRLTLDLIYAGRLMHTAGLVHRDIKPKNIMLGCGGRPVMIDFGFASFVGEKQPSTTGRLCIEEPGRVKGEIQYVLAPDVAKYRGCQEGDAYAMGKTLYELLFVPAVVAASALPVAGARSDKKEITVAEAQAQNAKFRFMIDKDNANESSRFPLSKSTADSLLSVVRGLCREDQPLSFAQAEQLLLETLS